MQLLKKLGHRHAAVQILNLATALCSLLMLWKGLGLVLNNESPVVVVLSESMEPAFRRGDLLFLHRSSGTPLQVGDITVYKIPGEAVPIVHRIIETHSRLALFKPYANPFLTYSRNSIKQTILTKGDNNQVDDVGLYNGSEWIEHHQIVGKVRGFIPHVGYISIAMNDYPQLKYVLAGLMGLFALFQREE